GSWIAPAFSARPREGGDPDWIPAFARMSGARVWSSRFNRPLSANPTARLGLLRRANEAVRTWPCARERADARVSVPGSDRDYDCSAQPNKPFAISAIPKAVIPHISISETDAGAPVPFGRSQKAAKQ